MATIIERNPEDNPRLNEIYEILLVAGYFRIRIASLKAFDKILGGLAWCITSSNYEIDVEYHDEMQIGEKIKVSEIICDSLIKMKCPYTLQPFQLQGLDVNNIFPIVQWLIKFVYETRWERQKYDRELSLMLGKRITKIQTKGNYDNIIEVPIERKRINRALRKVPSTNPVRVYSALLEYHDATASKMYNKLLNIITKKSQMKGGQTDVESENIAAFLANEEKKEREIEEKGKGKGPDKMEEDREMDEFGTIGGKMSFQKLEQIIHENKEQLEDAVRENLENAQNENYADGDEGDAESQFAQGDRVMNSQVQSSEDGTSQINKKNSSKNAEKMLQSQKKEEQRILREQKALNKKYQEKIKILEAQIQSFSIIEAQLTAQLEHLHQKHEQSMQTLEKECQRNKEYKELMEQMEEQLKQKSSKVNAKLEKLVERRQELKAKKNEIKKRAKGKIEELNQQMEIAQASVPEIDEEAFKEMLNEAELKKQIYDKKYEELTHINRDLAVLQRKAENYTSPPEIAQYHQRFVELFESINVLIEQKRSLYSETTNLQGLKKVVKNFIEIMKNFKEAYFEIKKKGELKDLSDNTKEILEGLETNMINSENTLGKIKAKREATYADYMDLIKLERDYLALLRTLKLEYENAARMYNS